MRNKSVNRESEYIEKSLSLWFCKYFLIKTPKSMILSFSLELYITVSGIHDSVFVYIVKWSPQ